MRVLMLFLHPRSPGAAVLSDIADVTGAPSPPGTEVADDVENAIRRFVESMRGCH